MTRSRDRRKKLRGRGSGKGRSKGDATLSALHSGNDPSASYYHPAAIEQARELEAANKRRKAKES